MNSLILTEEYFNFKNKSLMDEILQNAPYRKDLLKLKYAWTKYLKYYLILTYGLKNLPHLTKEMIYVNRYYWLKSYYHNYIPHFGEDTGIEQQIGNIIEEMVNELYDFDWNILEEISISIENTID